MNFLIQHYLSQHAEQFPAHIALSCLDESISYQELDLQSSQLANCLISKGFKSGQRVGIYMDKCLKLGIAIYGVLKAGGVYVPLDPSAPPTRLAQIVGDCDINIIISENNKLSSLICIANEVPQALFVIGIDTSGKVDKAFDFCSWEWVYAHKNNSLPVIDTIESDLAYIIYTSGSTGTPKGIMHSHRSCLSYVKWAANEVQIQAQDKLGNHCPLHFDISVFDWFAACYTGATVVIIPEAYTKMPGSYAQLIAKSQITVLFTVPFALIQLAEYGEITQKDFSHLRFVFFAGEPMPVKYLKTLMAQLPQTEFQNMYGPAETNGCTHYRVDKIDDSATSIPIGKAFSISQTLIVDEEDQPCKTNQTGELLVRTPTMMMGYWARPELNDKAFVSINLRPDDKKAPTRNYYRTGDLAKCDDLGLLWFLGRKDRQVKVRGYRVELDEIENVLVAYKHIEEAAVFLYKQDDIKLSLCACFSLKKCGESSSVNDLHSELYTQLNSYLKSLLPPYALPNILKYIEVLPRTSSGKIDRLSLSKEAQQWQ